MQDNGMSPHDEPTPPKPTKRKPSTKKQPKSQTQENITKGSKRSSKNEPPQIFQQEKSTSDSLPDSSTGTDYRSLRRRYLLLEEESFNVGKETKEIQDAVKSLEDEKLSLLDELVVLEGLVDPSEVNPSHRSP